MDPGPNGKRPRLGSWPNAAPSGTSLPHPHSSTTPRPHHPQAPPPPPISHSHHHPGPSPYQQQYPPRTNDHGPGPPAPVVVHGHAQPQPQHPDLDRRHHDQETLAPMQDHFRQPGPHPQSQPHHSNQPPSPAHPYHHQYPPRDNTIKRESGEDPRRSNSAGGHAPDSLPHTPHPASVSHPPPPHQPGTAYAPDGQQRHMGYENGPSVPPTPGGYRPPNYPPPTPTHQTSYESHQSYPPATEAFYGVYSSSASSKKKNTRASQACDQCRQLKAKCDETKPCKTCRDKGTECRYRDPVPKATDKAQNDIMDGINLLQNNLANLMEQVERVEGRLNKLEVSYPGNPNGNYVKPDPVADEERKALRQSPFDGENEPMPPYYNDELRDHFGTGAERMSMRLMAEDELEADPGPPVAPGEPAIPINHTTLAGLLLEWPTIEEIVKPHLDSQGIRHSKEYPISLEQNRGVLIVYGRGEDSNPSRRTKEITDHGQVDMADDSSDTASPSPAADWGHLGGLSPADQVVEYKGGVLASDGNPDFSEAKVWEYVRSFQEHILNMHPIIRPKVLYEWVQHFLDTLPSKSIHSKYSKPGGKGASFAVGSMTTSMMTESTGSKRKRSPERDGLEVPSTPSPGRSGRPERSIHNALVLTILALGKICQHRDRIYDALHQVEPVPHGSPLTRNGIPPSPSQGSPPSISSHSHSSGGPAASPRETERGFQSRRSSIHGSSTAGTSRGGLGLKKNYEAIPGLEYFAFATDILGNHTGAYKNMKNVYALIFAGLYHGQLARPMESFAFIHQASHKLQVIMRPSLDKLARIKSTVVFTQEPKYNQLALTFWTCLQLESDLIAEMQLPPSGLLSYEENMPHPNMSLLDGFDQRVLDSYLAQLYLRKHLNSIHRMFYAPDKDKEQTDGEELDPKFNNVGLVSDGVSNMQWVAKSFAFGEEDPPADDILAARLRAKYWGAQVITYRPFIRQILRWSDNIRNHPSSPNMQPVSEFRPGVTAPVIDPAAKSPKEIEPIIIEYAKRGIKALIESTRAFHGLGPERPIITNVFGTAHAQWGNLLVLSACFKDDVLSSQVDASLLQTLFGKTIQFLRQSSTATGSLRTDMHILEGVQRDLFPPGGVDTKMTGSFSSNASLQTPKLPMAAPPPHMTNPI